MSASNGMSTGPRPPSCLGTLVHASKEYSESVEANKTWASRASKRLAASEKATISVGHTKVKANGTKASTTYLPLYLSRDTSSNTPSMTAVFLKVGAGF